MWIKKADKKEKNIEEQWEKWQKELEEKVVHKEVPEIAKFFGISEDAAQYLIDVIHE